MKKKILLILFLLPISISCTNEAIDKIQPLLDNINNQIKSTPKSKTNSKVAHINGTITDENNNKISDVKIKIDDKETKSDSSGYYAINDLAIGKTRIIALKDGYEENNMTVDLKEDIQTINIKLKKSFIIVKPTSNIQVSSSPSIIPTSLITSPVTNPTSIQIPVISPTPSNIPIYIPTNIPTSTPLPTQSAVPTPKETSEIIPSPIESVEPTSMKDMTGIWELTFKSTTSSFSYIDTIVFKNINDNIFCGKAIVNNNDLENALKNSLINNTLDIFYKKWLKSRFYEKKL